MLEPGKYKFIGNVFLFGEKTVVKKKFTYAIANAKKSLRVGEYHYDWVLQVPPDLVLRSH